MLPLAEDDVLDSELSCASLLVLARIGIFSNAEQVVKCNIDKVTNGLLLGARGEGREVGVVVGNCYRHS